MLIWGSSGKSNIIGDAGAQHCNVCGTTKPFYYMVIYKVRHLWYLIRWSSDSKYYQICSTCQNGLPVELSQIEARNPTGEKAKHPIPFFDRFGWAIGLAVIGLFFTFVIAAGNADKKEEALQIAAPKTGDIYTIDVDKFFVSEGAEDSGSIGGDYGAFRVAEVKGGNIVLDVPKMVFNRAGGVRKDISNGKVLQSDYYDGKIEVPVAAMEQYAKDGAIYDIDRK